VELAVADHDTARVEDQALVLVDRGPAVPWYPPGDALRDDPICAGCCRGDQEVACSLPATVCPASTRSGTKRTPITPVAPAKKTRII
jgi:hypothetical protein